MKKKRGTKVVQLIILQYKRSTSFVTRAIKQITMKIKRGTKVEEREKMYDYWLPEDMIQHIQSFMSGKEAAQTAILSKSWYNAWLTSPNLYFNQDDFNNCSSNRLLQVSNKTLQRYVDSGLKIKSFKLSVDKLERNTHPRPNQVIQKAIEVGGSTDFEFELIMLSFDFDPFVLPHAVLGSEVLVKLSLHYCKIDYVKVNCRRLKCLRLKNVVFEGDMLENLISSCPLIEDLHLCWCEISSSFGKENIRMSSLKTLYLDHVTVNTLWFFDDFSSKFSCLENLHLAGGEISSFEGENIRMPALKTLNLKHVTVDTLFFYDFSSKFPCLENLNVYFCSGCEEVRLRSHSLKFISFYERDSALKAIFDVPRLRKFFYSGKCVPSLSFENYSNNWESYIQIYCPRIFTSEWFREWNELLLTEFKQSKVSLSLKMNSMFGYTVWGVIEEDLPKPVVENLILWTYSDFPSSDLFDNLFRCFRPMFVITYGGRKKKVDGMDVHKNLNQHITLATQRATQSMLSQLFDLEKADVDESFDLEKDDVEFYDKSFLEHTFRFRLRWGPKSASDH